MTNQLRSVRIWLALRSIELWLRKTLLTVAADRRPEWWDDVPEKIRNAADTHRSNSQGVDYHPVHYLTFAQLIEVIDPHWEHVSTMGEAPFPLKDLWSLNPIRNANAHHREITIEEEDRVMAIGSSLFTSVLGDDSEFLKSLPSDEVQPAAGSPFVFVPELAANHPLDKYFGLINGPIKSLGLSVANVTNDELNETDFRRRVKDCALIWIPHPFRAASFSSAGWFDAVVETILQGKPALINVADLDPQSEFAADWDRFMAKLGVYINHRHKLWDEVDYESYPANIVFKKENECLRDGALFNGVDEITVGSPYNIRKSALSRSVICGGPNTQCRDWTEDIFLPMSGEATSCMALSTFEIMPGTPIRVATLSGATFTDPIEDIGGRSYPGLSSNLAFAYNTLEWLLKSGESRFGIRNRSQ